MSYKILVVDLDNTIVDFDGAEELAVIKAFEKNAVPISEEVIRDYHLINDALWKELEKGTIEKKVLVVKRFSDLFKKYDISADAELVNRDYIDFMASSTEFIEGADEFLHYIKERYTNVLMSNGFLPAQKAKVKRHGLDKYFSHIIISDGLGFSKPDIRIYEYMEELLGSVDKSEVLVIGDSLSSDINGGNNYGVDTLWFNLYSVESQGLSTYEASSLFEVIEILKENSTNG